MIVLPDSQIVVLDIETTEAGIAEAQGTFPQPIELAALLIDCEYNVLDGFSTLVKPEPLTEFNDFCESFTGIDPHDIAAAPTWREVWRTFAEFTRWKGLRLVSWGVPFDYGVLRTAYGKLGVKWPHRYPFVDALSMTYRAAGEWGIQLSGYGLQAACERFGIEPEEKHRAATGVDRVVRVLREVGTLGGEQMEL